MNDRRATRGFATLYVALILCAIAVMMTWLLVWQQNSWAYSDRYSLGREASREQQRIRTVLAAEIRKSIFAHSANLLSNATTTVLNPLLTADPVFCNRLAGDSLTPGFRLTSLSNSGEPDMFEASAAFSVPGGSSPLDALRQCVHTVTFPYAITRRHLPSEDSALLSSLSGSVSLTVREIPATGFSLVTFEDLSTDSGLTFSGPALIMGNTVNSSSTFTRRITPHAIADGQIGSSEKVWEDARLAAGLLVQPSTLTDPLSNGTQFQNVARKGQILYFDGHSLSGEGTLPAAITASTYLGMTRVVVAIGALPQYNVLIDSSLADSATNHVSAYHIVCTTPLARDRGVVLVGTTAARVCDIVSTNGALILSGTHTGGPLLAASSFGGALFENSGDATWNAFLMLPCPSPFVSASSTAATVTSTGCTSINLSSGSVALSASDMGYDSITLRITPSDGCSFTAGLGSLAMSQSLVWVEGDSTAYRLGAYAPGGKVYSSYITRSSGEVDLTLSRTLGSVKLAYPGGTFYWDLPSGRRRVETTCATWSGSIAALDVVSNGAGTVLGTTATGSISLRGLLSQGTISRFGSGTFAFTSSDTADPLERVIPRVIAVEP